MKKNSCTAAGALLIAAVAMMTGSTAQAGREVSAEEGKAVLGAACWTNSGLTGVCCVPHLFGGNDGFALKSDVTPVIYFECFKLGGDDCPCAGEYLSLLDDSCK